MSKIIKFYHVAIYKNGSKTDNSFLKFIDSISIIKERKNIVRKTPEDGIVAIFPLSFTKNINARIIPFGKFRNNYKPFIGDINTSKLLPIKREVVEIVTMYYDATYNAFAIDSNVHGIKEKGIERYLNTFFEQSASEKWEVILTPINAKDNTAAVNKSKQIKNIEIKLKLDKMTESIVKAGLSVEHTSIIDFFSSLTDKAVQDIEANILKLEFGVGAYRNASLNINSIRAILGALNINNDCIDSLKLKYKNNTSEKIDVINFKNINVQLKDCILEDSSELNPASEYVGNAMKDKYNDYSQTILDSYVEFSKDAKSLGKYKLQEEPLEENRVEVREDEGVDEAEGLLQEEQLMQEEVS